MLLRCAFLLAIFVVPIAAHAQTLYKCVEAGKTSYSSTPCTQGAVLRLETGPRPSASEQARAVDRLQRGLAVQQGVEESRRERERVYADEARAHQAQLAEQQRQAAARQAAADAAFYAAEASSKASRSARNARANAQTAQANAQAAQRSAQSPMVTNCDGAGCWGMDGTRYNAGAGNTMFGTNGKICQAVAPGAPLQCN